MGYVVNDESTLMEKLEEKKNAKNKILRRGEECKGAQSLPTLLLM